MHLSLFFLLFFFYCIPHPLHEHIKVRSDMQCPGALSNMLLGLENFIFLPYDDYMRKDEMLALRFI